MTLISSYIPPTETLFPNKRLPPQKSRPRIPLLIWKTPNFIYSGNILPVFFFLLFLSPLLPPFTRRLVFNVFQRTSANYHWTSWDFHLAQLITLSSQVHYHIPLKKMHPTLRDSVCVCVCLCVIGVRLSVCMRLCVHGIVLNTVLIASGSAIILVLMNQSCL